MSWCDVTLRRSRPEGSAKGRAELTPQRKRDRALLQCLSAQCLMIDDHANFTSLPICARIWLTNTCIMYVERKHESAGCCQVARRPGVASHRERETRTREPGPEKSQKGSGGIGFAGQSVLARPRTTERGSHRCVLRAREGILPELSLLCLFVGRSAPNPPPFPFPHPLFLCPRILRGRPPPTDGGSGPGQLAVCFQRGPPGR